MPSLGQTIDVTTMGTSPPTSPPYTSELLSLYTQLLFLEVSVCMHYTLSLGQSIGVTAVGTSPPPLIPCASE